MCVTRPWEAKPLLWARKAECALPQGQENMPESGGHYAEALTPGLCPVLVYITAFNFPNYMAEVP